MCDQELLDSPEIQRIIVDNVPTMVLLLDERGRIAKVNAHFEKKTGFAAKDIVGKDWFSTFLAEEDLPENRALFADVLTKGSNIGHIDAVLTADGRRLEVEWFAKVITDPDGTRWLLHAGRDITARLEYEQALEAAKGEAERANAAKSRFLSIASHDLRQPMQALVILNEGLSRLADGPEQRKMLGMQREALTGMRGLLNTLLDIGKLESGAVKPDIAEVLVQDMFEHIRAELGPLAAEQGLDLIVEESTLVALTDATLLAQLIQNVVGNAIRYTIRGSVRLACKRLGATLELSIADTGIGIGNDQHEVIFDEFYQIDRNVSKGGLGLGLSIVKQIAKLLDYEVVVDSELGRGTTFHIRVPAAIDAPAPRAESRRGARPDPSTGTVLLVDDDAAVLAASRLLFEIDGFKVIAAASADEVTSQLEAAPVPLDLIVTDYQLHDALNGIDIVTAVRERYSRTIPAIVMTGDTSPSIGENSLDRLEILSKPIEPEQLVGAIQQLLEDST